MPEIADTTDEDLLIPRVADETRSSLKNILNKYYQQKPLEQTQQLSFAEELRGCLREAFAKVAPSDYERLFKKLSLFLHPDKYKRGFDPDEVGFIKEYESVLRLHDEITILKNQVINPGATGVLWPKVTLKTASSVALRQAAQNLEYILTLLRFIYDTYDTLIVPLPKWFNNKMIVSLKEIVSEVTAGNAIDGWYLYIDELEWSSCFAGKMKEFARNEVDLPSLDSMRRAQLVKEISILSEYFSRFKFQVDDEELKANFKATCEQISAQLRDFDQLSLPQQRENRPRSSSGEVATAWGMHCRSLRLVALGGF